MGWVYMVICLFDFMIAPIFFSLLGHPDAGVKWQAITIQGGGLFHLSMLTVLGVTSWGRNQQKLKQLDLVANKTLPVNPAPTPAPTPPPDGSAPASPPADKP